MSLVVWGCLGCWDGKPGHGDSAQVEVTCGQFSNEGGELGTAHWEVAGEDLAEALVEIGLDESNESSQHVLLYFRLCLEAVVDPVHCYQEFCEIEH